MTEKQRKWPAFITRDLIDDESDEMYRRWTVYRDEMAALIAKGGVHMDDDGWWIDDASGELIGPDPEIERPGMEWDEKMPRMTFEEVRSGFAASIKKHGAAREAGSGDIRSKG